MFHKLLIVMALVFASATAFAIPKPSEVKAAFDSGNYAKAESMLKEVMKERSTAPVHYQLGQVYSKQGKHADALNEFRQAQVLDPSLKFASSADSFLKNLANEQAIVAPPPRASTPAPTYHYTAPPVAYTAPPVQTESHLGAYFIGFIGLIILVGLGMYIFSVMAKRREEKEAQEANAAETKRKTSTLLGFSKSLEDALLIARSATYDETMKDGIIDRIKLYQIQTRNALADLKDGKGFAENRLAMLQTNVDTVVDQAANGVKVTEKKEHSSMPSEGPIISPVASDGWTHHAESEPPEIHSTARRTVIHHHYNNPAPAPAPVVVNNGGSGDLLTGVLIGEALSSHHDRTVYVERPTYETPSYNRPSYREPEPTRELDTPSYRQDTYSAPEPSFDTGSSSSDSYSDSGSSSMDSGSSSDSSDSY